MKLIAVTGPESSGKSSLTRALSIELQIPFAIEYARDFLETSMGDYSEIDLVRIARGQLQLIEDMDQATLRLTDTADLVIAIWSREKFGRISEELEKLLSLFEVDHYFLCSPDIPWENDPLRENPQDRGRLFELYLEELKRKGASFNILRGDHESRLSEAIEIIKGQ